MSGLRGALEFSAAEEAASRVSAVKRTVDQAQRANQQAATASMRHQLRQGLSELDAVREFLHDGINRCNQKYLDSGAKDRALHDSLERGLGELEDVRRKLVSSLNNNSSANNNATNTSSKPLKAVRPTSATVRTKTGGSSSSGPTAAEKVAAAQSGSAVFGASQKLGGQNSRPSSATVRRGGTHAHDAGPSASKPPNTTSASRTTNINMDDNKENATAAAPTPDVKPKVGTTGSGGGTQRMRPQSAPNRRQQPQQQNPPTGVNGSSFGGASTAQQQQPQQQANNGTGPNGPASGAQWAQYQDWAQKIMNRSQSRRVFKHRQFLNSQQQDQPSSTFEQTENHEQPPTASSSGAPSSSSASAPAANASSSSTAAPPAKLQRPSSATAATGGINSLRRAMNQTAASGRPLSATTRGASNHQTATTSSAAASSSSAAAASAAAKPAANGRLCSEAQAFREQGNVFFQQKRYGDAADAYGRAIQLEPNSETLYCNRAAASLMMSRFSDAFRDAQRAIQIDPAHVKAHWRAAKAALYLGNGEQARALYTTAQKLADSSTDQDSIGAELKAVDHVDRCKRCLRLREWAEALRCADAILEVFPTTGPCSMPWQCLRVEAQVNVDPTDALAAVTKMNQEDPSSAEAWYLRAKCVFYTGHDAVSTSSALGFINRAREADPKHARCSVLYAAVDTFAKLRDEGNSAYAGGRWQESYVAYTKCLAVDPFNTSLKAIILCNRAAVCIQCERWKDALEDINQSIGYNPNNAKTYTRRARIYQQQGNYDAAIKDLQLAVQMYPSAENQERLNQAVEAKAQRQRQQQQQHSFHRSDSGTNFSSSSRFFGGANATGSTSAGGASSRPSSAGPKRPQSASQQRPQAGGGGAGNNSRSGSFNYGRPSSATAPAAPQRTLYDMLGVPRSCDEKSIVKAYREGALKWHPDKWATGTDQQKASAETMFKDIANAYATLRDSQKRRQYDLTIMVA